MDYWYDRASFYHIYTLGFCGNSAERLGTVEKWIHHIKDMGCNAIYFGPLFESRTHGYDTTDYFKIDKRLGSNEDFRQLVKQLHENAIRVVVDGVFNHCGRDFFAFKEICEKGRDSQYCGWFHGLDFNGRSPFGDGFNYNTWNGYYELVKFDLNNIDARKYLLDAAKFWVEYFEIDGIRLDAADCLDFGFIKELRRELEGIKKDIWLMGEVVHGDYRKWIGNDMLHSVTNYEAFKGLVSSHNDKNLFEIAYSFNREFNVDSGIYKDAMLYNFVENHDQDRLASVLNKSAYLYTVYMLMYTMPGIPSLYYGGEWGVKGVRANGSDEQVRRFIDLDNNGGSEPELEKVIKRLSEIRNTTEALIKGSYKQIFIQYEQPFIFERALGEQKVVIIINITDKCVNVDLTDYNTEFYDALNDEIVGVNQLGALEIASYWGRILVKK